MGWGGDDGESIVAVSVCERPNSRLDRPWKWRVVWSLTSTVNSSGPV